MTQQRLERVNHIHITVPTEALSAARHFYCDVIGLTEVPKPEELTVYPGFWLQLDGLQLHVGGEDNAVDRWASGAHIAIQVEDLEERRSRLQAFGVALKEMVFYPGFERFEYRDPFGNRMELIMTKKGGEG